MNCFVRSLGRLGAAAACALFLMAAAPARADTAMTLFKSFSGNVNFAGTQVTVRDRANDSNPCRVSGESVVQSATLTLPSLATVVSAHLYWAGSGNTDTAVAMNGKSVTAASNRVYTSTTIGGGFNYFSAAADVTEQVKLKGAGTYTFSGLRVANGSPWCDRAAVLGGYALLVVYSHYNETYRALNLYEGFRAMLNSEVRLDMSNFRVPDNVTSSATGRFGHLVWEGDTDISQQGESLWFNDKSLTASTYGPAGNNFNSKSSVNGDSLSWGIDFDAYSLAGWPARLNSVSALFRTGGDLILLNAAVLAVPSTPAADLAVELVRSNDLRAGSNVTYTATVTNQGPGFEPGPVKLSLTLPTGLSYSSFSGTNWSCTGSGTTANCTYTGSLNNGAKTVLTLVATVASGATGSKTTSVTVAGNNDPGTNNNQDSDTAAIATAGGLSFEYTARECKAGELVAAEGAGVCPLFAGPVVAGTTPTIWLTAVDANNRARVLSTSQTTAVGLSVALGCVNPAVTGKVKATYAGIELNLCEPDSVVPTSTTAWKTGTAGFPANTVSLPIRFRYADVGLVKLYVRSGSAIDFVQFVSIPDRLRLVIRNEEGMEPNPGNLALGSNGFVRAGEPFILRVEALGAADSAGNRDWLQNFGLEQAGKGRPILDNLVKRADVPAGAVDEVPLEGAYAASGAFAGSFTWSDIGSFRLTVSLMNYLGVPLNTALGRPLGASSDEATVGRFYPAYFSTKAGQLQPDDTIGPGFACLPRMRCPYVGLEAVNGAVYSRQPYTARITAHDENGRELANFDAARLPNLVPKLTLTAVNRPGSGTPFGTTIAPGLADTASSATTRTVSFGLGTAFNASASKAAWLAPTAVYLRATAPDIRQGRAPATNPVTPAVPARAITISSVQTEVAESVEGGVMVVNGRLAIGNTIGSELLKTPIPVQAQYWTGTSWENNTGWKNEPDYASPTPFKNSQASFSGCPPRLSVTTASGSACDTQVLKSADATTLTLASGGGSKFLLAPVGAGRSGSFRIQMNTFEWLPSMFGQVTIGSFKSPVIYIREMY